MKLPTRGPTSANFSPPNLKQTENKSKPAASMIIVKINGRNRDGLTKKKKKKEL